MSYEIENAQKVLDEQDTTPQTCDLESCGLEFEDGNYQQCEVCERVFCTHHELVKVCAGCGQMYLCPKCRIEDENWVDTYFCGTECKTYFHERNED